MIAASSDWHLGGGGLADDSNVSGIFWVTERALDRRDLTGFAVLGDSGEGLQFKRDTILRHNLGLLRWIDARLYERNIPFYLIGGNHDPEDWPAALRDVMRRCDFRACGWSVVIDGWYLTHGNQWDVWNRFGSPLKPVANWITRVAGWIERRGWDIDGKADPRRLVSPAHATRQSLHGAIHDGADEYAEAHGLKVCYGHTHRWRISQNGRVVNCGCCVNAHAEVAFLPVEDVPPTVVRSV